MKRGLAERTDREDIACLEKIDTVYETLTKMAIVYGEIQNPVHKRDMDFLAKIFIKRHSAEDEKFRQELKQHYETAKETWR